MSAMDLAREERSDLVDFLGTLTPEEWETASLCAGWSVHDVVAHMISYDELGPGDVARRALAGRFALGRTNDVGVAEYGRHSPAELIDLLRTYRTPVGLTAMFGGRIGLLDALIHHQDVRRPLGRPREIPAERLLTCLAFALFAPPIRGALRARGVRLVATDLDWSFGRGPLVQGPAEALLMAIAGRRGVVDDLAGPGVERIARRVAS